MLRMIAVAQSVLIAVGILIIVLRRRLRFLASREFILVAGSTVFAVLLLEMALRIWLSFFSSPAQYRRLALYSDLPAESYQWAPHPYLIYYPRPDFRKGLLSHNSLGYRGREFDPAKPDDTYRIVTLGGSTTYTVSVNDDSRTFPAQLERILREDHGYQNVEVINAGAGGYSSWESLINLQFRVLDIEPDLIIVYHGVNDVHMRLVVPDAYRGDNSGKRTHWSPPPIPPAEHSLLLRLVTREPGIAHQAGLSAFVDAPTFRGAYSPGWTQEKDRRANLLKENPPVYFQRNMSNIVSVARANDVSVVFATWAHSRRFNNYVATAAYERGVWENNQVVKEIAQRNGVLLFDFASVMPEDENFWTDGLHVNEDGALLKAGLFADFVHRSGIIDHPKADPG